MAHYNKPYERNFRAQKRIHGEDVYGNKIRASTPSLRNYSGRRIKNDLSTYSTVPGYCNNPSQLDISHNGPWKIPPPPPGFTQQDRNSAAAGSWRQIDRPVSRGSVENVFFRPIQGAQGSDESYDTRNCTFNSQKSNNSRNKKTVNTDSEYSDDSKTTGDNLKSNTDKQPVDLIISNLDASIGAAELRRLLASMLKEYAMIYSLKMITQTDGTICANIRVSNQQEAQFAISQLHRQKLGQKRIVISYAQTSVSDPQHLKALIVNILQEVPDKCMALFKFMALMESRYQCTLSVSEVNKLKDVCKITEQNGSRIISLTQEVKSSPPPNLNKIILSYCTLHCPNGLQSGGWCEINTVQSPNVMMPLKFFANQLYNLLDFHTNSLPLLSFQSCYEQSFQCALPVDDKGVSLEHFIMCVPNISIKLLGPSKSIKIIKRETKSFENDEEMFLKGVPPSLASNITLLCRELVDLLRTMEKCQLPLAKFIPAYHHHFGRQCRVADYGYTKLVDLFDSISHVVQIIGDGTRRLITLSHSAQMKRFTSDLLKVLKVQPSKQITMTDFPSAYEKILNKPFSPVDYGLCTIEDLLGELPESTIVVTNNEGIITIGVPKREQTAKEIAKTKEFSIEVVDLLKHSPYCTLIFHKFVPAYHHHFGHQCKVSEYGFTKLIELFEAIPDVVKVVELPEGERAVCLTLPKMLQVLNFQISSMIKNSNVSAIELEEFPSLYLKEFGYPFKSQVYECETVEQVILNLSEYVQLVQTNQGLFIVPVEEDPVLFVKIRAWSLLLEPPYCKELSAFKCEYEAKFSCQLTIENINDLKSVVSVSYSNNKNYVSLTRLFVLAAQMYRVLFNNGGNVYFNDLESCFLTCYGNPVKLEDYNIKSANDLVQRFNFLIFIRGNAPNRLISLNMKLLDYQIPLPTSLQEIKSAKSEDNQDSVWRPSDLSLSQKKIAPPKPDTPPTPGTTLFWNSPRSSEGIKVSDFSIRMPLFQTPRLLDGDFKELVSPGHLFYSSSNNLWGNNSLFSNFSAPDAAELPMPDKLISKGSGVMSDDSVDSGVNTTKLDISPPDMDQLGSAMSSNNCRSAKLQYPTFFNFN